MKIFISQPMRGKTDAEILAERERAIKAAKAKWGDDVEALESFFRDNPTEAKPLWFWDKSLKVMADADAVIVCKGWSEASGCKVEIVFADAYKLPVVFLIGGKLRGCNE